MTFRAAVEPLEIRIIPAVQVWTGAVGDRWSAAGNWQSGVAPVAGDRLVFPATATTYATANDIGAGTGFDSIEVDGGGYGFTGNAIGLDHGIKAAYTTGTSTFSPNIHLNGAETIEVDGGTLDVTGVIGGGFGLTKTAAGTLRLEGTSSYTGKTTVSQGSLQVDGNITASGEVDVNSSSGGLLGGGTVPTVVVTGSSVALGSAPASLATGSVTLNGASTFAVDLAGTTAGSGYSRVVAGGAVHLGGASLAVNVGYAPTPGDQFTILKDMGGSAIPDTFGGLAEGAVINAGGSPFQVTYAGGTSHHDVDLTALATTTTALATSQAHPVYGQSVTFTATVSAGTGTPTGTVTFVDNGVALPSGTVSLADVGGNQRATYTTALLAAGTHTITADYNPAANALDAGSIGSLAGNPLVVTPAALTITAVNKSKTYGAALPTLAASYAGFVNGDTSASLTAQPTLSTAATAASHVAGSPYAINVTGAIDADYTIGYVAGSLSVTPVALTITADDQTKASGAPMPTLTSSYAGLVDGDTAASLTTQPTLSTTATASSGASGSPYVINVGGAVDPDYSISYVDGTLTVSPALVTHYVVAGLGSVQAGVSESFTVTAEDMYNNAVTDYSGTVDFTSDDPIAVLPADAGLTDGTGTFAVTFKTVGTDSVSAKDSLDPGIGGTDSGVAVAPDAADVFILTGLNGGVAGTTETVTVTARDRFGNVATGFSHAVDLGTSDGQGLIPATVTLTEGVGQFDATLETAGMQSVTASYSAGASITGTEAGLVTPAAATSLVLDGLTDGVAGLQQRVTVTARDAFGNVATAYDGTVHFTSGDPIAVLPSTSRWPEAWGRSTSPSRRPGRSRSGPPTSSTTACTASSRGSSSPRPRRRNSSSGLSPPPRSASASASGWPSRPTTPTATRRRDSRAR